MSAAPGELAQTYLDEHAKDVHPATGRTPIVNSVIRGLLQDDNGISADQMAHNATHGDRIAVDDCGCGLFPHREEVAS